MFAQDVLARLGAGLREPIKMKVTSNLTCGDWAVIEMFANGCVAKAGWTFDNNYCWVCRFDKVHNPPGQQQTHMCRQMSQETYKIWYELQQH